MKHSPTMQVRGRDLPLRLVAAGVVLQLLVVLGLLLAHQRVAGVDGGGEGGQHNASAANGPAGCLGATTAELQIKVLVAQLVAAMPLQPDTPEGRSMPDSAAAHPSIAASAVAMADEPAGRNPASNIPGVQDVHAELQAYTQRMLEGMTASAAEAARRQQRVTAAELGLRAADPLDELASLPARIAYLNQLAEEVQAREALKVAITATTSVDVAGLRQEVLPWLQYHTELGVTRFFLLYDGSSGEAVQLLASISHVELMHIRPPWATPSEVALYGMYSNVTRQWAGHTGNWDLMFKQGFGEQEALRRAGVRGFDWLLHLDPDELFLPGGATFSLTDVLSRQPPHIPAVRFMNFEGQPEAGEQANRFEQVTLFRVHKHFITPEAFRYRSQFKLGDSAAFLYLYANGKSAVRVDAPGVRHSGPHFFTGDPSPRWQSPDNPAGTWVDAVSDDSVVLHYAYSYLSDVEAKARRSCPDQYLAAALAGDRSLVKQRCFVIDFDVDAYMAASQGAGAVADFFYTRNVLSEGVPVKCTHPTGKQGWCSLTDVERLKFLLQKLGLLRRMLAPQVLLRQQEWAIQQRIRTAAAAAARGQADSGTS